MFGSGGDRGTGFSASGQLSLHKGGWEVMEINEYKEVHFDQYCKLCIHEDDQEISIPCFECLTNPVNLNSHKPTNFKEA